MMTVELWQPPAPRPRRARYEPELGVLALPDALGLRGRQVEAPLLTSETELWVRPSSSACFPVNPAAVTELHSRVAVPFGLALDALGLEKEQKRVAADQLWRVCSLMFVPGQPVRSAIDAFLDGKKYLPDTTGLSASEKVLATRLSLLATKCAISAITAWVGEVR